MNWMNDNLGPLGCESTIFFLNLDYHVTDDFG